MTDTVYSIPLAQPDITEREIEAVVDVLRSRHISLGPRLPEFEGRFTDRTGAAYAVAVNSGTSGLHLCLRALGIGEGDEVITTPYSFIASANCMLFERAKPVFIDIDPVTLNIDATRIEEAITERTKAILPVHVFGLPADMDAIMAIAEKHNLAVIEDACEALGATVNGVHAGSIGDCGTFAFYPNKQITTGEGGVIVTNREDIARLAQSMRNQGRDDGMGWLSHTRLGFNYRISDLNCALGIIQMDRLDEFLESRTRVAEYYNELFAGIAPDVIPLCDAPEGIERSWFVYVIQLSHNYSEEQRDTLIKHLRSRGIGCNHYFPPIHLQPFYREQFGYKPGDFPVTESAGAHSLAIPFYNSLSRDDAEHVVTEITTWIQQTKPENKTI
jgi:perosamine synthetase